MYIIIMQYIIEYLIPNVRKCVCFSKLIDQKQQFNNFPETHKSCGHIVSYSEPSPLTFPNGAHNLDTGRRYERCPRPRASDSSGWRRQTMGQWSLCHSLLRSHFSGVPCHSFFTLHMTCDVLMYRVSHITGPTLFLLFSRVLEHIQRNFS